MKDAWKSNKRKKQLKWKIYEDLEPRGKLRTEVGGRKKLSRPEITG